MQIKEISNKTILNEFVGSQARSQFLQSWNWGEFQKSLGRDFYRRGVFEGSGLSGSALVIKQALPLGKFYWYCPRGLVVDERLPVAKYRSVFKELLADIVSRAQDAGAMFVKIEPPLEKHNRQLFDESVLGYTVKKVDFVQPPDSWYLNLNLAEEELLKNMHQKTRYNIRLAEKKGVRVRVGQTDKDFEIFWRLNQQTTQRDQFHSHRKDYYSQMFKTLAADGFLKVFLAELNNEPLAVNLVIFFGDTATYLHGASSDEFRNVMAPHLLQWRQIQAAKIDGLKHYDFWGVAPEGVADHGWTGLTRFKKGFGGQSVSFIGAFDLILNGFWYKIYKLIKKIKR